uniref:Cell cycle control protein n=1 Tax=Oncorhynchus mykiss TaxID=8022 RepID=A0A8C7VX21_ONCMY
MGKAKANAGLLARRPDNLAFKHQRLPVWSPMLTAHTILPSFYCMATIRVKLGVCLLATVQNTHELKVDYTHAGSCDKTYMDSRDDGQMPFIKENNGLPIAPCWAMANSMFNGITPLPTLLVHVHLFRKGIPWYTDKNVKFRNPPDENKTLTLARPGLCTGRSPCLTWTHNNGFINEDLIVEPFTEGLPTGNYCIHISYSMVLSTVSWFGSQNNFLPVAYLITGCLILLLAVILTAIWWKFGKNRRNMEE